MAPAARAPDRRPQPADPAPARGPEPVRTRTALGLVALAVALTVAAYPPIGAGPLALGMLAPLVAALEGRSPGAGFRWMYLYSVVMAIGVVRWLAHPLVEEYGVAAPAAWSFIALLVGAYAVVPASAGALYCALRPRLRAGLAPLVFAALFVLAEWLRAEPLALPWLLAAQPLAGHPAALQTADLGGVYAVGFVVAAQSAGLGVALHARRAAPLAGPAVLAVLAIGYGTARLAEDPAGGEPIRIGVIQAAVPQGERFQPGSAERNTRRHIELTRALAASEPLDLVVWSETAVDAELGRRPELARALARLAADTGVPLVTGAPRSAGGRRTNSALLFAPEAGLVEWYDKQRLVPFSEADPPFAGLLEPLLGPLLEGDPYVPGDAPQLFERAPVRLATPICFEITYPALARGFRAAGAELLVNLSNDAWFGRTGYAELHLAHAVFRAIELRSYVLRAANTGISAVIDPAGRVLRELPVFEEGALTATVHAAGAPPLYARAGDAPVVVALLLCAGGALLAGPGREGRRRAAGSSW